MGSSTVTGAILAGGPNAGMSGALKALLPLGSSTVIGLQIQEMRKYCDEIIVVTNTPKPFFAVLDSSVRIITDYYPGRGPLGGLHAALRLARSPYVWIAGSDMPFISARVARQLTDAVSSEVQAVIPIMGERPVALHGLYDKRCAETAALLLGTGDTSMEALLGRLPWLGLPLDHAEDSSHDPFGFAFTIHRPEDYEQAKQRLASLLSAG